MPGQDTVEARKAEADNQVMKVIASEYRMAPSDIARETLLREGGLDLDNIELLVLSTVIERAFCGLIQVDVGRLVVSVNVGEVCDYIATLILV